MTTITVEERLAQAQASGNLDEIRSALHDAEQAGAESKMIEQALAEVDRMAGPGAAQKSAPAATPDQAAAELRNRAEAFKKKGNDRLKDSTKSAAREALDFFTAGLEVQCSDPVLNAQLHSNSAHVRILLRQFVEAVDECRKAIELDHRNIKAYWRAAKASLHLELCKNGIDFCEAGLKQAPNDTDLLKLRDACAEKLLGQQQRRSDLADRQAAGFAPGDVNADEAMAVQEKLNSFTEQVETLKSTLAGKQRDRLRHQLTKTGLAELPPTSGVYTSVGRGFLKRDRSTVEESLDSSLAALEQELPKLSKALQELEKRKEGAEKELKEMISAFKQQVDRSS